jgi:hypothetical protein
MTAPDDDSKKNSSQVKVMEMSIFEIYNYLVENN